MKNQFLTGKGSDMRGFSPARDMRSSSSQEVPREDINGLNLYGEDSRRTFVRAILGSEVVLSLNFEVGMRRDPVMQHLQALHDSFVQDIGAVLDTEAGLRAILQPEQGEK